MEQLAKLFLPALWGRQRKFRSYPVTAFERLYKGDAGHSASIDVTITANAMVRGTETAYKAVMKPKEGTILTVAKGMADKAIEMAAQTDDIEIFAKRQSEEGDYVLSQTPEMLPVLAGRRIGFRRSGPDAG